MTILRHRPGGSSVYANLLSRALAQREDIDLQVISAPGSGPLATVMWMSYGAVLSARRRNATLIHSPAFLSPLTTNPPNVLTIHDLSLGRMPEGHPLEWRLFYRWLVPRLARQAHFIVTPTETTRRDVIDSLHVDADRVTVTPLGIDDTFRTAPQRDRIEDPEQPLLVFPGPPLGRKNLDLVLRAMSAAGAGSALAGAHLEITGAGPEEYPNYRQMIEDLNLTDRVRWLGKLHFEDIPPLYSRADLLVYPSFLEGFGLPPLEAMAVGTPVVASNASCVPEVVGDAALLVDPSDVEAFVGAVESVLTSRDVRCRLVAAGKERAGHFTWTRCAALTADVYHRAAA